MSNTCSLCSLTLHPIGSRCLAIFFHRWFLFSVTYQSMVPSRHKELLAAVPVLHCVTPSLDTAQSIIMQFVDPKTNIFLIFSRPYLVRSRYWYAVASGVVCRLSVTLCIVAKRCVLEQKLLLRAYRKSYIRNRLVPK